tara:strand:- start:4859 stop:5932 length:1074 start_codon:yes stop_codon:yes gene_type:complete
MNAYFGSSVSLTKLTISFFMFGAFFGMLIFGTIADSFGRRKIMIGSLLAYIIINVLIVFSPSMDTVIALRFLSGIAAGSVGSMNRAQATDIYSSAEMKKVSSAMTIAWGLGPIMAPFIGGFLQQYIGWQACFIFLGAYALVALSAIYFFIPETHTHKHTFNKAKVLGNYKKLLTNRQFLGAIIQSGILYMIFLYFGIVGSFYVQDLLHYSPVVFGYLSFFIGVAYFIGTIVRRALTSVDDSILLSISFMLLVLFNALFLAISFFVNQSLTPLMLNIFIDAFLIGILYPIYLGKTLSLFPELGGTSGAVAGASVMLIISAISFTAGFMEITTLSEFLLLFLITVMISFTVYLFTEREN